MAPYIPTPHQVDDSNDLLEYEHGFVWADPGTGKTVTAMEAFRKGKFDRMLVICPKIAVSMWVEEIVKHLEIAREDIRIIRSSRMPKGKTKPFYLCKVLITTVDLAGKSEVGAMIRDFAWGKDSSGFKYDRDKKPNSVAILDEAHAFKTPTAKRTQAVHGRLVGDGVGGLLLGNYEDVWQLTGTPITRHADDLFIQLAPYRREILKAYNVETYDKWVNEFCVVQHKRFTPNGRLQRVITGSKNERKLKAVLESCKVIRRKLSDVVDDLPPITYRDFTTDARGVKGVQIKDQTDLIRELNKPDSHVATVRRLLGIAKAADVAAYLTEYGRKPVLVGTWHREVTEELMKWLEPEHKVAKIDGSTSGAARTQIIKDFNNGRIDFLLGQVASMGVAVNLQAMCDHIVLAEELASPAEFEQFVARVYRRGQKRHVQVDIAQSDHALDEALRGLRMSKEDTIKKVV